MTVITTIAALEALYMPAPVLASTAKVATRMTDAYRRYVEASPFVALATVGPEGADCSPRGDHPGFVRIHDDETLMMPDRRGNNRIDSLRNIVRDPRCAFLFLLPGSGTTFRAQGKAHISIEPALLDSFATDGKPPRSVIVLKIDELYFQCARAIVRSELWNPERHIPAGTLPTPGDVLAEMTQREIDGKAYDKAWPERARQTLW